MIDAIARIESRIQEIQNLVGERPEQTSSSAEKQPLTALGSRSKEEFGTQLQESLQKETLCRSGNRPFRVPLPEHFPLLSPGAEKRSQPGEIAPVTLPLVTQVRSEVSGEAIPLDPDEAVRRERYLPYIREASASTGLPEALITAVIQAESSFKPETVSSAGAMGLMQLMPDNVRELGVTNAFDPRQNILAGARHLRDQVDRFGTLEKSLAAYNAGPGKVVRYGGVPPYRETQNYVQRITGMLRRAGALREVDSG